MGRLTRMMRLLEPVVLVALPVLMMIWAWLELPNAAIVTSAAAVVALVPFFVSFESGSRRARDIMPVIVMTALAVAGRLIFAPVPAVKPVYAIVIMAGSVAVALSGLAVGSLVGIGMNIILPGRDEFTTIDGTVVESDQRHAAHLHNPQLNAKIVKDH